MNFSAAADKLESIKRSFQEVLVGRQHCSAAVSWLKNRCSESSVFSTVGMGGGRGGNMKAHGDIFIKQYDLINSKGENQRDGMSNKRT